MNVPRHLTKQQYDALSAKDKVVEQRFGAELEIKMVAAVAEGRRGFWFMVFTFVVIALAFGCVLYGKLSYCAASRFWLIFIVIGLVIVEKLKDSVQELAALLDTTVSTSQAWLLATVREHCSKADFAAVLRDYLFPYGNITVIHEP